MKNVSQDTVLQMIRQKDMGCLDAMLEMNLQNWSNYEFVKKTLGRCLKMITADDEENYEKIFELACLTGNKKVAGTLLKKKKGVKKHPLLASAPDPLFHLVARMRTADMTGEEELACLLQAAGHHKAKERLLQMQKWGFSFEVKDLSGKNLTDLLEERIRLNAYEKNKSGSLKKQQDKNITKYIYGLIADPQKYEKKKEISKKSLCGGILLGVLILGISFMIGYDYYKDYKSEKEAAATQESQNTDDTVEEENYLTDTSLEVADGDTVNIDYVGTVDGVEFDGGNTQGAGTQLTIGSGSYIDDFEEQLIGHHVGETVKVQVTFPEDYGKEDLNGKDAVFEVTINGIYE